MTASAPRLDPRLIAQLDQLARGNATAAEIRRALVARSRELGIPPPSYEHVRRLALVRRIVAETARESAVLPVVMRAAVGLEHGNEILRVARGGHRWVEKP